MVVRVPVIVTAGASALLLAACGAGSTSSSSTAAAGAPYGAPSTTTSSSATPSPTAAAGVPAGGAITLSTAGSSLGTILVDAHQRTVYLFEADTTSHPTCNGPCASAWPPVVVTGAPVAGGGVNAALLGTTMRSDGRTQVTYKGHPLYDFAGDSAAGQTRGEGATAFGGSWYVVAPSGDKIDNS